MFELVAIAALAVSGISAIGSSLWALSVYRGKRDKRATELPKETDGENVTKFEIEPTKFELDIGSITLHALSPAPQNIRDQVIAASLKPLETRTIAGGEEWKEAIDASLTLIVALNMAQRTLDLGNAYIDYRQFINRSRPEDIEDFFHGGRHQVSLS